MALANGHTQCLASRLRLPSCVILGGLLAVSGCLTPYLCSGGQDSDSDLLFGHLCFSEGDAGPSGPVPRRLLTQTCVLVRGREGEGLAEAAGAAGLTSFL